MTEFKCADCGGQVDIVHCGGGTYSCLPCVNSHIRANNAQHEAQRDYEAFRDAGGQAN